MNSFKKALTTQIRFVLSIGLSITVLSVISSPKIIEAQESSTNESKLQVLKPCIPELVTRAKIDDTVPYQGSTYYRLMAFVRQNESPSGLIIKLDSQNRCIVAMWNPAGDRWSLERFVPQQVARQFELQELQRLAEKLGGKDALQRQIDEHTKEGETEWLPEEAWAVEEMGLKLPLNIKIVNPPVYEDGKPVQVQ
jgi:hypothetical protein